LTARGAPALSSAPQTFVDPSYGKLGFDLMRAGRSAPDDPKLIARIVAAR
jgi:hypothetical protein